MPLPSFSVRLFATVALFAVTVASATAQETKRPETKRPEVELDTTEGTIVIELYSDKAPKSAANFLEYVKSGHYDGTVFHRVIAGFMIQGGGFDKDLNEKKTKAPIVNEAGNGLPNKKYTLAMARTNDPDSATCQFFINTADNASLNRSPGSAGYAVFGRVVKGLDVVDKIGGTKTKTIGHPKLGRMGDVPATQIVIKSAKIRE